MTILYDHHISVVVQAMLLAMRDAEKGKIFISKISSSSLSIDDFKETINMLGVSKLLKSDLFNDFILELDQFIDEWLDGKNELSCTLSELFERYFIGLHVTDPEALSYLGLLEKVGFISHNAELSKPTPENVKKSFNRFRSVLKGLENHIISHSATSESDKLSIEILKWDLNNKLEGEKFVHHSYAIEQMDGIHVGLMMTFTDLSPLNNLVDVSNYMKRLEKIPARLKLVEDEIDFQKSKQIVPPVFVFQKVSKTLKGMISEMKENSDSTLVSCIRNCSAFKNEENATKLNEHIELVRNKVNKFVLPSYESLLKKVEEAIPFCQTAAGVWGLPDGDKYYEWCLKEQTTTSLTPKEIHELGLVEVANLLKEMKETCDSLRVKGIEGFEDENKSAVQLVKELCERDFYLESEKDLILEDFRKLTKEIEEMVHDIFPIQPKMKCKIEAVPEHMQEGSPAAFYFSPALDGSRDGTFYVNMGDVKAVYKCGMRTLTAHEAIPGHHFQLALSIEAEGIPYFRKANEGFTAYVEGWGLYAEKLAREIGFYKTEKDGTEGRDLLGHFSDELLRAARLVVDTGLHQLKWTREQAIEYMEKNTTLALSDAITEVERYCVLPGQACSYKIGQLELLNKRKEYLGTDESLKQTKLKKFHELVLLAGAVPLYLLQSVLEV